MRTMIRLMTVASIVACLIGLARASGNPYYAFGGGLERIAKDQGGGKRVTLEGGGQRIEYSETWFGLKRPVDATYEQAAGAKTLSRIVLHFPTPMSQSALTRALREQAGMPAGRPARRAGHMSADWTWHGVAYHLESASGAKAVTLAPRFYRGGQTALSNAIVLQDVAANVAGRGSKDRVLLAGIPFEPGSIWMKSLYLVLAEPGNAHGGDRVFALGFGGLFASEILVRDFTGDRRNEILVSAPTGGSGGLSQYALVSMRGGRLKPLVDSRYLSGGPKLSVTFLDGFKARVECKAPNRRWTLDLHSYKDEYVKSGVYTVGGRLCKPTTGAVDGVGLLTVRGGGSRPTLAASQKIWGTYHANSIGTAVVRWRWRNGALRIVGVRVHAL